MSSTTYRNQYSPKNTENWQDVDLRSDGYNRDFATPAEATSTLRLFADSVRYDYRLTVVRNGETVAV